MMSINTSARYNFLTILRTAIVLASLVMSTPVEKSFAEVQITPRITISEEYNDNLFETGMNRQTEYITHAQPGIALRYTAPLWDWDISYIFEYRHYAKRLRADEENHNLNGSGNIILIDNLLFLDVRDTYSRVSLDVARNTTTTTADNLYVNQTDQNVFTASPYFVYRPSTSVTVRTGYTFLDNWYKDPTAESRRRHSGAFDVSYEMTSKVFLNTGYRLDRELSNTSKFYRHEAYIGPRYEYADKSFISAQGGVTRTEYDSQATTTSPYWIAGITHTFDTVTASLSSSVRYTDDPLGGSVRENIYASLTVQKNLLKGSISVNSSYSDQLNVRSDTLTSERLVAGFNSTYEFIEDFNGRLGFTFENYKYLTQHGTTRRYFVDSGLSYLFGNNLSLTLNYRFTTYESAQIAIDNMQVNRIVLEVSKVFNQ